MKERKMSSQSSSSALSQKYLQIHIIKAATQHHIFGSSFYTMKFYNLATRYYMAYEALLGSRQFYSWLTDEATLEASTRQRKAKESF